MIFRQRFVGLWRRGRSVTSFGGQVFLTVGTNLGLAAAALITGSLVARLLGPQGRGQLAAVQTSAAFIGLLASLGLPDAVVYFSGRFRSQTASYLASAVAMMVLSAIPFVLVGWLVLPLLLQAQAPYVIVMAQWYLVAYVFLMATAGMLLHPLRGQSDFAVWNTLRVFAVAVWLVALIIIRFTGDVSTTRVAGGYLVSLIVTGLVTLYVLTRRVSGPYSVQPQLWFPMLRFGLPTALTALPQTLNLRLDQMLMAAFLPANLLGYYVIAVAWSAALSPVLSGIGGVIFPRVASQNSGLAQLDALSHGTRLGVVMSLLLTVVVIVVTPMGIRLIFGSDYIPATSAAIILVIASAVSGLNFIFEDGLRGLGHPKTVLYAESIGLLVTIVALTVLLPPFQIVGAAIASFFGYTTTLSVLLYLLCRLTGRQWLFFMWPSSRDWRMAWTQIQVRIGGRVV